MEVSSKLGIKEKLLQLLIAGYGIGQFVLLVSGYGTSLSPCISYGRVRPLPDISSGELGALFFMAIDLTDALRFICR